MLSSLMKQNEEIGNEVLEDVIMWEMSRELVESNRK